MARLPRTSAALLTFATVLLALAPSSNASAASASPLWDKHVAASQGPEIQEHCHPVLYKAHPGKKFRGSIILLHGFTPCPQQYFDLASQVLAPEGFNVYLPLLPGHGRLWKNDVSDVSAIPNSRNWQEGYGSFIDMIAAMAKELPQPVSIGGLSLGATLTLWSVQRYPDLYEKAVILTPFLSVSKEGHPLAAFLAHLIAVVAHIPGRRDALRSWGPACYTERDVNGRAGNCHFTASQLYAMAKMGDLLKHADWTTRTKLQFVTVGHDPAVDNGATYRLMNHLRELGIGLDHVEYPFPTNHSMLSPVDGPPGDNKFWLPHIKANVRAFFAADRAMVPYEGKVPAK